MTDRILPIAKKAVLDQKNFTFFSAFVEFTEVSDVWWFVMAKNYADALCIPKTETCRVFPESYCKDVHIIGGAVKAGNALTATKEGYEAGTLI